MAKMDCIEVFATVASTTRAAALHSAQTIVAMVLEGADASTVNGCPGRVQRGRCRICVHRRCDAVPRRAPRARRVRVLHGAEQPPRRLVLSVGNARPIATASHGRTPGD